MKYEVIRLYENREDVTLTAYVLDDSFEMLNGKPRPAVLVCPGGGYINCADSEAEPVAMRFAAMGYHAFVLRYSVYCEGKEVSPEIYVNMPVKEHCQYPVPMQEIGGAMLILHERRDEWHIDMNSIILCGFSAGSHNCAMYATHWDKPVIYEHFEKEKDLFRPAAVILGYGPSDFVNLNDDIATTDPRQQENTATILTAMNTAYFGKPETTEREKLAESPALLVSGSAPPMYIWGTAGDQLVPIQQSLRMAMALANARIPFELHIFQEGEHGLSLASQASANDASQIQDAGAWVDLAERWIRRQWALPLA